MSECFAHACKHTQRGSLPGCFPAWPCPPTRARPTSPAGRRLRWPAGAAAPALPAAAGGARGPAPQPGLPAQHRPAGAAHAGNHGGVLAGHSPHRAHHARPRCGAHHRFSGGSSEGEHRRRRRGCCAGPSGPKRDQTADTHAPLADPRLPCASQRAKQVWLASSLLSDSLAVAAQTLLARSLAAGQRDAAAAVARRTLQLSLVLGGVLCAALALGGGGVAQAFSSDPGVLRALSLIMPAVVSGEGRGRGARVRAVSLALPCLVGGCCAEHCCPSHCRNFVGSRGNCTRIHSTSCSPYSPDTDCHAAHQRCCLPDGRHIVRSGRLHACSSLHARRLPARRRPHAACIPPGSGAADPPGSSRCAAAGCMGGAGPAHAAARRDHMAAVAPPRAAF